MSKHSISLIYWLLYFTIKIFNAFEYICIKSVFKTKLSQISNLIFDDIYCQEKHSPSNLKGEQKKRKR